MSCCVSKHNQASLNPLQKAFSKVLFLFLKKKIEKAGAAPGEVPSRGSGVQKVAEDCWWAGQSHSQTGAEQRLDESEAIFFSV